MCPMNTTEKGAKTKLFGNFSDVQKKRRNPYFCSVSKFFKIPGLLISSSGAPYQPSGSTKRGPLSSHQDIYIYIYIYIYIVALDRASAHIVAKNGLYGQTGQNWLHPKTRKNVLCPSRVEYKPTLQFLSFQRKNLLGRLTNPTTRRSGLIKAKFTSNTKNA